jgi:tetratricopeptide (TPR) repeat protein
MKTLRVDFRHFWPQFEPEHFLRGFSYLEPHVRLVHDTKRPDLLVTSSFVDGSPSSAPPVVDEDLPRLFFTAENVRPDFSACEYALSFCRDIDDERHLRLPNHVFTQHVLGLPTDGLLRPPIDDPSAIRSSKTRFCTFLQANDVAFRNEFVKRLARYKHVDCAGPCLNNTGSVVSRADKHSYIAESKFVVAFENEAAPGYTTEKLADALLARSVPLYWGDPTVTLDFNPDSFLHLRDFSGLDEFIEHIIAVDQDDALYEALLAAPAYAGNRLPDFADPDRVAAFFDRLIDEVEQATAEVFASVSPPEGSPDGSIGEGFTGEGVPGKLAASYVPGALGFHGDVHLMRLVHRLLPVSDTFIETGTNVGTTLGWVASTFPRLPGFSCEPDLKAAAIAREHSCTRPDVQVFGETSQDFMRRLQREHADLFQGTPFVWLDAHDYGFEWPLRQEVAFFTSRFAKGYLFIDDFRVPGAPEFGYASYGDQTCSLEHVESALPPELEYDLYYPAYSEHTSPHHPLRGWGLFVFGRGPRPDLERELPGVVRRHTSCICAPRLEAAEQAFEDGDFGHAEALVRRALVDDPRAPRAWNDLGACLAFRGRSEEAILAFTRALRIDGHDTTALANLLDVLETQALESSAPADRTRLAR